MGAVRGLLVGSGCLLALSVLFVAADRAGGGSDRRERARQAEEAARVAALTPAQRAAELRERRERAAQWVCRDALPGALNDPRSFEAENFRAWPVAQGAGDQWTVTARFRARNGFGAVVLSQAVCEVRITGDAEARVTRIRR